MARYFLELAYKGTHYKGWQIQPNAPSVQQTLQEALSLLLRESVSVVGAGRTDTGVHAAFYVAHFDTGSLTPLEDPDFCYHLNCILPKDIAVSRVFLVKNDAHARFHALQRQYKYYISTRKNPFTLDTAYLLTTPLDLPAMNRAAQTLLLCTDFSSFEKLHSDNKTSICRLTHARWEQQGDQLVFTIAADRFLRNMVRAIVGTLIDVGKGKITEAQFADIVRFGSRSKAGTSAPACGLFLTDVQYGPCIKVLSDSEC